MPRITSSHDPALSALREALAARADDLDQCGAWPQEQLALCREYGVFEWFAPREWQGQGWSDPELLAGYMQLAAGCVSTAFVLTQPHGVIRRVLDCDNRALAQRLLGELVSGQSFASVGISHLTTSRQHMHKPMMTARAAGDRIVLDGVCPWVTGGVQAKYVITGAQFDDGTQALLVLPTRLAGVTFDPPAKMVGLTATQTGAMHCRAVELERDWLLGEPCLNVIAAQRGGKTGSLQTSALALGLADAALGYLANEARQRVDLHAAVDALRGEHEQLKRDLLEAAAGSNEHSNDAMRSRANSLVLRATHAALIAAKGTGYLTGHPVGRWCREALFFLVWSCPQSVASATLCELALLA